MVAYLTMRVWLGPLSHVGSRYLIQDNYLQDEAENCWIWFWQLDLGFRYQVGRLQEKVAKKMRVVRGVVVK